MRLPLRPAARRTIVDRKSLRRQVVGKALFAGKELRLWAYLHGRAMSLRRRCSLVYCG